MVQNGLTERAPDRRKSTAAGDARIVSRADALDEVTVGWVREGDWL